VFLFAWPVAPAAGNCFPSRMFAGLLPVSCLGTLPASLPQKVWPRAASGSPGAPTLHRDIDFCFRSQRSRALLAGIQSWRSHCVASSCVSCPSPASPGLRRLFSTSSPKPKPRPGQAKPSQAKPGARQAQPQHSKRVKMAAEASACKRVGAAGTTDADEPLTKKQRRELKKQKDNPNFLIAMAAKFNDSRAGLGSFRAALASGQYINPGMYNTVLHLCTGGENWDRVARGEIIPPAIPEGYFGEPIPLQEPLSKEELLAGSSEIEAELGKKGIPDSEILYTCRCRLAMLRGDLEGSFALAMEAKGKGMVRLRTFTPPLLGFCLAGKMDRGLAVVEACQSAQLELSESEYALLLEGSIVAGCFASAHKVMTMMKTEVVMLQRKTLELLHTLFSSPIGGAAFQEGGVLAGKGFDSWQVTPDVEVNKEGECEAAGSALQIIDLTPAEMEQFAEGIRKIAREKGRAEHFDNFIKSIEENPREIMLDGANIALFGQNFEDGGFNFGQLKSVMAKVAEREPDSRQLVFLHIRRINAPEAEEGKAAEFLKKMEQEKALFVCPKGSNDDWYWLYAAVKAGPRGMIVSNDEMRDHIFSLLSPKYFLRWKQHHQIRYSTGAYSTTLHYPPKFTTCIQELPNGAWMFPATEGNKWLCAKPVKAES